MSDVDRILEQPPRLSSEEQLRWGVEALKAERQGEARIEQDELADEMADQRRDRRVYDDHTEAAEALQDQREDVDARRNAEEYEQAAKQRQANETWNGNVERLKAVEQHLPLAQEDYQERLAAFHQRAEAIRQIESPAAQAAVLQMLQAEADQLGTDARNLQQGRLLQEQHRLHELRPGLADAAHRESFITWGMQKYGVTRQQAESIQDMPTLLHYYDQWQGEQRTAAEQKAQREADAKANEPRRLHRRSSWGGPHGTPQQQTLDQARETLRRTGDVRDAVDFLAMARAEAKADG